MKSKYLKVKDHNIHYLTEGYGEHLIILPSLWVTSKSYEEIGEKLSQYYTVIIPDIYKGESTFKKSVYEIKDYFILLKTFVDKLKIPKTYLLGISFSGILATEFSNNFPEIIDKLLLLSTSATTINIKNKLLKLIIGYLIFIFNNLFSIKGFKTNIIWFIDSIQYFFHNPKQYLLEGLIAIKNYEKPTSEIKVISRLIFAKKDEFIPLEVADINSRIKNLEVEFVDKTHAWMFIEQEELIKKIRGYFK